MTGVAPSGKASTAPRRWLMIALLVPGLGLFALFLAPTPSALTNGPALLVDSVLRALAVIALALIVAVLLAAPKTADRAAAAASALCLLVGVSVLFSGLWTPFRDWWAMTGAAVVAASATVALYLLRGVWSGIKVTNQILIGVLVAAPVPLFNFWAQTSYLPSQNAASLELSTQAAVQTGPAGQEHWVITSTIRNRSDVRAFVIASGLTACRWPDETHWQRLPDPAAAPAEHCENLSRPFDERSWLDPDATLRISTPARVDAGLPLMQVRLRVAYARADRVIEVLDSQRDATADERGACQSAQVWNLQPQSRLAGLARRELALMYADVEGDGGTAYFFGAADSMRCVRIPDDRHPNQTRFQGLNQYLSLTEATTVWASWPGAPSTARDAAPN